jgi:hypothetical protein
MGLHYEFPGKNIGVAKVNHGYSQYYDILWPNKIIIYTINFLLWMFFLLCIYKRP